MNTVLVVAEDEDSGVLLRHLFEINFGCDVMISSIGGVRPSICSVQFDLAIVDCTTSLRRGAEVVRLLEGSGMNMPIVFYSAEESIGGSVQVPGRHIPLIVKPDFKGLLKLIAQKMAWQKSRPEL